MSISASLTSGVAGRYATALFEIAKEGGSLDRVEADVIAVQAALAESPEFRHMIHSPVFSREDMTSAIRAIAARMQLGPEVSNTIGLMAANRRLFVLPGFLDGVRSLIAEHRGEVTAEVTTAKPLSDAQASTLREMLKQSVGKDVELAVTVDPGLIGGLVVKVGSRMIDSSIRSKLSNLQNVMKEVG